MVGSRRLGREAALQALYLNDLRGARTPGAPPAAWSEAPLDAKTQQFAQHLVDGVQEHLLDIDRLVKKYTENWELGRMATVDRCVLRLATFELLHDLETPVNVIINEAVEIAKKFSTSESGKFVNGILDKVKQERYDSPNARYHGKS